MRLFIFIFDVAVLILFISLLYGAYIYGKERGKRKGGEKKDVS